MFMIVGGSWGDITVGSLGGVTQGRRSTRMSPKASAP